MVGQYSVPVDNQSEVLPISGVTLFTEMYRAVVAK